MAYVLFGLNRLTEEEGSASVGFVVNARVVVRKVASRCLTGKTRCTSRKSEDFTVQCQHDKLRFSIITNGKGPRTGP